MNATRWVALAGYVRWLGSQGFCDIEQTERGWYITLIDKDPDTVRREMECERKEKMDVDDEKRRQKLIAEQIKRDKERGIELPAPIYTDLIRKDEEEKIQVSFNQQILAEKKKILPPSVLITNPIKRSLSADELKSAETVFKKTALDEVQEMEEKLKEKRNRKDYWLHEGIIVKIITNKLDEKYYRKKGVVIQVENRYQAIVKMLNSHDKIRIDQSHAETVIPAIGKKVLVVNGAYRGQQAILEDIHQERFSVDITLLTGSMIGTRIENMVYEDVSKLAEL